MAFSGCKRIKKPSVCPRAEIDMEKVCFYNNQGEKLAGILHKPDIVPASAVIISHGFGSSKKNKEKWASGLCVAGFLVLRFDFSGHGESEGEIEETTVTKVKDDLDSAIKFVRGFDAGKIGLTGHSLGGLASLLAARQAQAVAPIAPPTDLASLYDMRGKTGLVDIEKWKRDGSLDIFGVKVNYGMYEDAVRYDQRSTAKSIACPVMLIHGDKDDIVPLQQSIDFVHALQCEKRLEILEGVGHDLNPESRDKMIELTKEWFMEWLS